MEQAMNSRNDDPDDAESNAAFDEVNRHGLALHQLIQDYIDEHHLSEEMVAVMLINLSVRMRMVGYVLQTERPSASGLKLNLDRFRSEIDSCLRAAKKDADGFISQAKTMRAAAENEADEEPDENGSLPS